MAAWEFEYAIKLMPERPEPYNNLALVYEAVGKFNEAADLYETAHGLQPENPHILGNLIRNRLRRGETVADVRRQLETLIYLDPRPDWSSWAREKLGLAALPYEIRPPEVLPVPEDHGLELEEVEPLTEELPPPH